MKALIFLILLSIITSSFAQEENVGQVPDFLKKQTTKILNPLQLRDPFKRTRKRSVISTPAGSKLDRDNSYSNRPQLGTRALSDIRVVAIFLGKNRRAVAKILNGSNLSTESYTIKEGDLLGQNQAEVKAIVPGGLILVERIKNIYDQDEFIETILPVSVLKN